MSHRSELSSAKSLLLESWRRGDFSGTQISGSSTTIEPRPPGAVVPLTTQQEGVYRRVRENPTATGRNIAFCVGLRTGIDVDALSRAVQETCRRHETLRTKFVTEADRARQVIQPATQLRVTSFDLTDLPPDQRRGEAVRLSSAMLQEPFDIEQPPLARIGVFTVEPEYSILTMAIHHIVADGWSLGVALNENNILYKAYIAGKESPLPALPVQFGDYAIWEQDWLASGQWDRVLPYWREHLRSIPALNLPYKKSPGEANNSNGSWIPIELSGQQSQVVRETARKINVTPYVILLTLLNTMLSKVTRQEDVVVAVPTASRRFPETFDLIGYFTSQIPFVCDLSGDPTLGELLERVREAFWTANANNELPMRRLAEELSLTRETIGRIYQVVFVLQPPLRGFHFGDARLEPIELDSADARYGLFFQMWDEPQQFRGRLEYQTDLFERETVKAMFDYLVLIIDSLASFLDLPISRLPSWPM